MDWHLDHLVLMQLPVHGKLENRLGPINLIIQYLPCDMVSNPVDLGRAPGLILELKVWWAAVVGFSLVDERELTLLAWFRTPIGQAGGF